MAVKAKEQVTVSWIIDIASTTKYYLLQSSTATPPSKPTANPPGGNWKTAEPAYTSGSTNTLYTVEQTLWTNGKATYSAVCKSSSYEAAKEAWNKAQNAQNTANSANSKIDGLEIGGRNLIRNGDFSSDFSNYWAGENMSSSPGICRDSGMGCNFARIVTGSRIYNNVNNVWNKGQNYTVSYWARKAPSIVAISKYENTGKVSDIITITSVSDTAITLACTKPTAYAFISIDLTKILIPGIRYKLSFDASGKNESISIDEATDDKFTNRTLTSQKEITAVSGRYYRMKIYANVTGNASTEIYTNAYTNIYLRPVNDAQKLTPSRSLVDCGKGSTLTYEWQKYVDSISCTVTAETGTLSFSVTNKAVVFEITKVKLEKGNKATDWTPAPEDTDIKIESYVESEIKKEEDFIKLWAGQTYTTKTDFNSLAGRTGTLETWKNEASQKITKDGIIATVGSYYTKDSDFQSATTRITNAESRISQLNDSIELKVEKDGIISAINQTSENVTISASKINLSGYVSISDLKTSGKTIVNGSNVTTGTISADRIDVKSLFAKTVDATNLHVTGKSTFDGTLNSAGGTFSGTVSVTKKTTVGTSTVQLGVDSNYALKIQPDSGKDPTYFVGYNGCASFDAVSASTLSVTSVIASTVSGDVFKGPALTLKDKGAENGSNIIFNWSGKTGQPTWLWGGDDVSNMYVYNPSNFSVASAAVATHVSIPRVGTDVNANGRPATSRAFWREYNSGCAYLPDANFYHIFTAQSVDENYTTQLALGMTTQKVAYRLRNAGTWGDWREIPLLSKIGDLTVPAGLYPTTGIYDKHGYANTTTNLNYACYVSSNYRIARYASSSKRYKHDIAEIFDATCRPEALYDLPVVTYRYNDGYCPDEPHGEKLHIGFIAEDVDRIYPAGCGYRDGVPENWNIMEVVPGMLKLIQDQHRDIIKQSTRQDAAETRMESLQYQLQQAFMKIEELKKQLKTAWA